jgi:amino acid transporter
VLWLKRLVFGKPRDLHDPRLFHKFSLIAFLAWVGLGADGLSSSSYGPEQAYRALGSGQGHLAIFLAVATALTVFIISYTYTRIIEHFPHGGGGYLVASKLLGNRIGVVSGCALLVDYVLTITTSVAAGGDAVFSFVAVPLGLSAATAAELKLLGEVLVVGMLIVLNLRGVRDTVTTLLPIFLVFVLTHAIFIGYGLIARASELSVVSAEVSQGTAASMRTLGLGGLLMLLVRAYSLGGGTYTGIEAVSNGIAIMREPKLHTGKRTMLYMASSLAVTAGGILVIYMLVHVRPTEGQTLNASALEALFGQITWGGHPVGAWFIMLTLLSEGALLFVAAQTGFIDGPRVMANMAIDSWWPHQFAALSERLTMKNGVLLMGLSSLAFLLATRGSVDALVVMYSINVFLTFSLSQLGMVRLWLKSRQRRRDWRRQLVIQLIGLVICASILVLTVFEKFLQGGWLTILITAGLVTFCFLIRRNYFGVAEKMLRLNEILGDIPGPRQDVVPAVDRKKPTALILVREYGGLGIHLFLNVQKAFPRFFHNFVFLSVGILDSAAFKGSAEVERLEMRTEAQVQRYVNLAHRLGVAAEGHESLGTDPVADTAKLVSDVASRFDHPVVFGAKLVFEDEAWYQRFLYNDLAYAVQRRVQQQANLAMVILPVRVRDEETPDAEATRSAEEPAPTTAA